MFCFDNECDPQFMRLYIHIEKYFNGSIDICVMRFGSTCMKGTNPSPNICYANAGFVYENAFFDTHRTYATWDDIIQYKYENVVDDILI